MKMIKGIIFDMDGLLIDSEASTYKLYQKVFIEHGLTLDKNFYLDLLGTNEAKIIRSIAEVFNSENEARLIVNKVHEELNTLFEVEGVPVKTGVFKLLNYLEKHSIKKAVATSSSRQRAIKILKSAGLYDFFDVIVCGDEVSVGKPNPEIFIKATNELCLVPEEVLVFEDSENGIKGAYAGGMHVVNIPDLKHPSPYIHKYANKIINNLEESIVYIKSLIQ